MSHMRIYHMNIYHTHIYHMRHAPLTCSAHDVVGGWVDL